jgi:hypothetical protein
MAQRFTVYDVMEARGDFRKNPANVYAQAPTGEAIFAGPVEYPKMFFHPEGKEMIIVQGEVVTTPLGPKTIGEQRALIHRICNNPDEEEQAVKEGWHRHPSQAIAAAGKEAPATGAEQTIEALKKQIEELQKKQKVLEQHRAPNPLSKPIPRLS